MRTIPLVVAAVVAALAAPSATAQGSDPNLGRNLAATCANCHGTNGVSVGGIESLAGKPKDEIVRKMQEFKSGTKPATIMHAAREGLHRRADRAPRRLVRGAEGEVRGDDMSIQRRDFLKALGAAGLGSAAAALPGCATTGGGAGGKVVVVGGGYGGATAAKYIRMWSDGGVDVTVVEPNPEFISCPLSNLVLGGSKQIADVTVSYDNLARRHGVRIVRDTATAVDADKRIVKLAGGGELPYDRLILSPGVDFMWDKVPSLNNADAQAKILHAWKAGAQTVALRNQLRRCPTAASMRSRSRSRRTAARPDPTSAPARSRGTSSAPSRNRRC